MKASRCKRSLSVVTMIGLVASVVALTTSPASAEISGYIELSPSYEERVVADDVEDPGQTYTAIISDWEGPLAGTILRIEAYRDNDLDNKFERRLLTTALSDADGEATFDVPFSTVSALDKVIVCAVEAALDACGYATDPDNFAETDEDTVLDSSNLTGVYALAENFWVVNTDSDLFVDAERRISPLGQASGYDLELTEGWDEDAGEYPPIVGSEIRYEVYRNTDADQKWQRIAHGLTPPTDAEGVATVIPPASTVAAKELLVACHVSAGACGAVLSDADGEPQTGENTLLQPYLGFPTATSARMDWGSSSVDWLDFEDGGQKTSHAGQGQSFELRVENQDFDPASGADVRVEVYRYSEQVSEGLSEASSGYNRIDAQTVTSNDHGVGTYAYPPALVPAQDTSDVLVACAAVVGGDCGIADGDSDPATGNNSEPEFHNFSWAAVVHSLYHEWSTAPPELKLIDMSLDPTKCVEEDCEHLAVGSEAKILASLTDQYGDPMSGQSVRFEVYRDLRSDPAPLFDLLTSTTTSDGSGVASLTYSGPVEPSNDQIFACHDPDTTCSNLDPYFVLRWEGPVRLEVEKTGSGSGTVTRSSTGTGCTPENDGASCELHPFGSTVTLSATPDSGHTFEGWSSLDADCGSEEESAAAAEPSDTCDVTMLPYDYYLGTGHVHVGAEFSKSATGPQTLTLTKAYWGDANGTVVAKTGTTVAYTCAAACEEEVEDFPFGTEVTLQASTGADTEFLGWSGDVPSSCLEDDEGELPLTCIVTMSTGRDVEAEFARMYTLDVEIEGDGYVLSEDLGDGGEEGEEDEEFLSLSEPEFDAYIDCDSEGGDCSVDLPAGSPVELYGYGFEEESIFAGWSGGNCYHASGNRCTVIMVKDRKVTANFVDDKPGTDTTTSEPGASEASTGSPTGTQGDTVGTKVERDEDSSGDSILITETPDPTTKATGYQMVGGQVFINAARRDETGPLKITFEIDRATLVAAGLTSQTVAVLRNGVALTNCIGATEVPAPKVACITSRLPVDWAAGGNAEITVIANEASVWNFAKPLPVKVSSKLTLKVVKVGKKVTASGGLTPKRAGKKVSVSLLKKTGKKFVKVAGASPKLTAASAYKATFGRKKGQCKIEVKWAGDATSKAATITKAFAC